jgi:hypothetical protein
MPADGWQSDPIDATEFSGDGGFRAEASGAGGAEGNRTPDLCSAIAALSHLSYSPAPGEALR